GGSGLIGSKLVTKLRERGYKTLAASPASGVNMVTGQGLAAALDGASVVVDVSNSPSFEGAAALEFFQTSTRNLLAAESAGGVAGRGGRRAARQWLPAGEGCPGETDRGLLDPPTRSSTRPSSSSSSAASPTRPPAATWCAWHTCSSSP